MVKLCGAVALALLLLIVQHGAVRHALQAHAVTGSAHEAGERHVNAEARCEICQGFASVAFVLANDGAMPGLLIGAGFALPAAGSGSACGAEAPASRSRGPPARA